MLGCGPWRTSKGDGVPVTGPSGFANWHLCVCGRQTNFLYLDDRSCASWSKVLAFQRNGFKVLEETVVGGRRFPSQRRRAWIYNCKLSKVTAQGKYRALWACHQVLAGTNSKFCWQHWAFSGFLRGTVVILETWMDSGCWGHPRILASFLVKEFGQSCLVQSFCSLFSCDFIIMSYFYALKSCFSASKTII